VLEPLPSYGRGRDAPAGRFTSLIFGTNLTDVIVTGKGENSFSCMYPKVVSVLITKIYLLTYNIT